jgi:hypothetical protein
MNGATRLAPEYLVRIRNNQPAREIALERRRGPSGRDRVVHPPSRRDDIANVAADLVHMLVPKPMRMFEDYQWPRPEDTAQRERKLWS